MDKLARIEFALDFANADLERYRPSQWIGLREDLAAFLGLPTKDNPSEWTPEDLAKTGGNALAAKPPPKNLSEQELKDAQKIVRQIFGTKTGEPPIGGQPSPKVEVKLSTFYLHGAVFRHLRGRPEDLLFHVLLLLLEQKDAPDIRKCPECGKYFIRIRRQIYCSRPCVDRANKRRVTASQDGDGSSKKKTRKKGGRRAKKRS